MIRQHQIDPDVSKTGNPNIGTNIFYRIASLLEADKVYVQEPERLFRKPAAQAGFGGAWRTGGEYGAVSTKSFCRVGPMKPELDKLAPARVRSR